MDVDNVENTAPSSNMHRIRSNSVIDSSCFRQYSAVLGVRKGRIRSKSLSTTDYYVRKLNFILQIINLILQIF